MGAFLCAAGPRNQQARSKRGTLRRVTKGTLTQKELGWLLAQEAKGAADRLRLGVQYLRASVVPPPLEVEIQEAPPSARTPDLESTLDALDDAMRMLGALHQRPPRGRRGRMDLAALLWELTPEARVALEPGAGTEVYGDEEDFRRMLQVLLGRAHGDAKVTVRREDEVVSVGVPLGSEGGLIAESERAWLSRMAVRYGGSYDVRGDEAVLSLPADGARERAEREALQRELDEARKQGEVYAKELAVALRRRDTNAPPPLEASSLSVLTQAARGIAGELRALMAPLARELATLPEDVAASAKARVAKVQELVADLADVGDIEHDEEPRELDLAALVARITGTPASAAVLVRAPSRLVHELVRTLSSLDGAAQPQLSSEAESFRLVLEVRVRPESLSRWRVQLAEQLACALHWFCEITPHEGGSRVTLRGSL